MLVLGSINPMVPMAMPSTDPPPYRYPVVPVDSVRSRKATASSSAGPLTRTPVFSIPTESPASNCPGINALVVAPTAFTVRVGVSKVSELLVPEISCESSMAPFILICGASMFMAPFCKPLIDPEKATMASPEFAVEILVVV